MSTPITNRFSPTPESVCLADFPPVASLRNRATRFSLVRGIDYDSVRLGMSLGQFFPALMAMSVTLEAANQT